MLHPLQLEKISGLYSVEVGEIRDFLQTLGISVETTAALADTVAELRTKDSFRRNLTMHMWALLHTPGREVSTSDAVAILAVAAAGPLLASQSDDEDALELLRFVIEAHGGIEPLGLFSAQSTGVGRETSAQAALVQVPQAADAQTPAFEIPLHAAPGHVKTVRMVQDGDDWGFEPTDDFENEDLLKSSLTTDEGKIWRLPVWGGLAALLIFGLCFALWLQDRRSSASITVQTVSEKTEQPASVAAMENKNNQSINDSSDPILDPFRVMSAKAEASRGVVPESHRDHAANEAEDSTGDRRIAPPATNPDHTEIAATSRSPRRPSYFATRVRAHGPVSSDYAPDSNATPATSGTNDRSGQISDDSGSMAPAAESSAPVTHSKTLGGIAHTLWHGLRRGVGKVL